MSAQGSGVVNDHGILADPTASDMSRQEKRIRNAVQSLAQRDISEVSSADDVAVRDLVPAEDLESGADNGWDGSARQWDQSGLTADSVNETYQVDSGAKADSKVVAIFAVSNLAADPSTTELIFESTTGGTFERLQTEGLITDEEVTGLIADPIVLRADQDAVISQYSTATSDQLILHGAVAEPTGQTLEESARFLSKV